MKAWYNQNGVLFILEPTADRNKGIFVSRNADEKIANAGPARQK